MKQGTKTVAICFSTRIQASNQESFTCSSQSTMSSQRNLLALASITGIVFLPVLLLQLHLMSTNGLPVGNHTAPVPRAVESSCLSPEQPTTASSYACIRSALVNALHSTMNRMCAYSNEEFNVRYTYGTRMYICSACILYRSMHVVLPVIRLQTRLMFMIVLISYYYSLGVCYIISLHVLHSTPQST